MPYTLQEQRDMVDPAVTVLANRLAEATDEMETADCAGQLNYVITTLLIKFIKARFGKIRYKVGAMISGALVNVYSEFYRRVMVDYENRKIEENGDVGYEDIL